MGLTKTKAELKAEFDKLRGQQLSLARKIEELNHQQLFEFVALDTERRNLTLRHRHVSRALDRCLADCMAARVAVFR